jgi:hypothetical protein
MIELSKIASIAGEGGLFLIKTPLKNGVLLESLDEKKTRIVAGASSRVSILSEISVYTQSAEGSVSLESVLRSLNQKYAKALPLHPKSDGADLKKLLLEVLPDADMDRVYVSDIKKLVTWYHILQAQVPEIFADQKSEQEAADTEAKPKSKKTSTDKSESEKSSGKDEKPAGEKKAKKSQTAKGAEK